MDIYDKQAEELLPFGANSAVPFRPAVAAALRKQAWINDAVYQGMEKQIVDLRAELVRLREEREELGK